MQHDQRQQAARGQRGGDPGQQADGGEGGDATGNGETDNGLWDQDTGTQYIEPYSSVTDETTVSAAETAKLTPVLMVASAAGVLGLLFLLNRS